MISGTRQPPGHALFSILLTYRLTQGFFHVIKQRIREHLRTVHTDADLKTWFEPLVLHFADVSGLEVCFPHLLFAEWFTAERQELFECSVRALFGAQTPILYKTASLRPERPKKSIPARISDPARPGSATLETTPPQPGSPEAAGHCSFENFIINSKNEFPVSMAKEVAGTPKNPAYNPFVICGKGTCGKSHLLKAVARAMAQSLRWENVFLGTVQDLAEIAGNNGGIRAMLLKRRAVCLDNAQHLANHPELQQDIMDIADLFRDTKKPLVLALDESLARAGLHEKLRSRLESGLIVALKKPDLDVRLRYARAQAEASRLQLKKEYMLTLVQRFDDFRHLEGILTKLAAFQNKSGRPINQGDLDKVLLHAGALSGKRLTPEAIVDKVAEQFSLTREDILGNDRKAEVVRARQIGMYLCRDLLGTSLSALGEYFSGKNHATVLYAYKKIKKLQDSNKDMHRLVTQIRKKCALAEN